MSMLTSSATRNALYNSFKRIDGGSGGKTIINGQNITVIAGRRGSATENIGDITGKLPNLTLIKCEISRDKSPESSCRSTIVS